MRRAQTTVEYMLTISVISIAIIVVVLGMESIMRSGTSSLASSLATSLTDDGVQSSVP